MIFINRQIFDILILIIFIKFLISLKYRNCFSLIFNFKKKKKKKKLILKKDNGLY